MPGSPTAEARARGVLVGAALGDAFGSPLEGAGRAGLSRTVRRRAYEPVAWGYTDDAMMVIAVAESIRDTGGIDPRALLGSFSARYEPARGFGRGMKLALRAFAEGTPWHDVAAAAWPEGSRGNGGAVRVAPVPLRRWPSSADLLEAARTSCRVTHAHPEAVEAAAIQALAVDIALHQPQLFSRAEAVVDHLERELGASSVATTILLKVRSTVDDPDADIARVCGTSPFAIESMPAALASILRYNGSFEEAVVRAAELGGDVDSICAMVGALAGALHGVDAIPTLWRAAIRHESPTVAELCALADAISALPPGRAQT